MTITPEESVDELQQETGSLVPIITAILAAATAYAATHKVMADYRTALKTVPDASGLLLQIAIRAIMSHGKRAPKSLRLALTENVNQAAELAVEDGYKVIEAATKVVVQRGNQVLTSRKGTTSPSGQRFEDNGIVDIEGQSDDPKVVARRVAQAVRNSAVFHAGKLSSEPVRKSWECHHDARVRATHAFLGNPDYEYHTVNLTDPFVTIAGNSLMFPGDPSAPFEETAHCRCWILLVPAPHKT